MWFWLPLELTSASRKGRGYLWTSTYPPASQSSKKKRVSAASNQLYLFRHPPFMLIMLIEVLCQVVLFQKHGNQILKYPLQEGCKKERPHQYQYTVLTCKHLPTILSTSLFCSLNKTQQPHIGRFLVLDLNCPPTFKSEACVALCKHLILCRH